MYVVRLKSGRLQDYPVPSDGRVILTIPAYRQGCSVYLFNVMKLSDGYDPLKDWTLEVQKNGVTVRQISFRQLTKLPTDSDGYRLIKIEGGWLVLPYC